MSETYQTSSGLTFTIKRYNQDYLNKIKDLWNNLLIDRNLSYATSLEGVRQSLIHEYPPSELGVLAEDENGNILGFAQLIKKPQPQYQHTAQLALFYSANMHGVGVGTPLLNDIFKLAEENGLIRLELRVNDERRGAKALYKRLGFKDEGLLVGSYMDPEGKLRDEVLFSYLLKDISSMRPEKIEE